MKKQKINVLIMAGGSGTRLWPLSRENYPKQLLNLSGDVTLLNATVKRAKEITSLNNIVIGTSKKLAKIIRKHNPKLKKKNFLIEPEAKNTAPIIALHCAKLREKKKHHNPLLVLSADHYITSASDGWTTSITSSLALCKEYIFCFGIIPSRADTGYGYIELGENIENQNYSIKEFKEKPNKDTAQKYLESGNFLWNSGIFLFTPKLFLSELASYKPKMLQIICQAAKSKKATKKKFPLVEKISVDYAIMENSKKLAVCKATFDWDDLGSYEALARIYCTDEHNNYLRSKEITSTLDSSENIVSSVNLKSVSLLGVSNLVIAEKDGHLLIAKREEISRIKEIRELSGKQNPQTL